MLVKNTGTKIVRLAIGGSIIEIKSQQCCDIDEKIYNLYKSIFPRLLPDEDSVVIHSVEAEIVKPEAPKAAPKKTTAKKKK